MIDNPAIHIILVRGRDQFSDWVAATLRAESQVTLAGVVPTVERAVEAISHSKIDILLIDTTAPDAKDSSVLQSITANPLGPAIVLLATTDEMAFVQQAMFAGARGFLLKPFTHPQLMDSVRQIFEIAHQHRTALAVPTAAPAVSHEETAKILVVFSPKGGVGCTSLATNLAIALKNESGQPVILVDGDVHFGDVDIAVNIVARKSIADLVDYMDDLEAPMIDSVLMDHPSGIQLLLAPPRFDPALEVSESWLSHVVKLLASEHGGYIVVDAPAGVTEPTLNLLDAARQVLLVTGSSVASLRATKRFLDLAIKMDYSHDKLGLVLSGYRKEDLSIAEIERHLDWPLMAVVPGDVLAMALALNRGQPLIMRDRNHAISKAIIKLARLLSSGAGGDLPRMADAGATHQALSPIAKTPTLKRLNPKSSAGS